MRLLEDAGVKLISEMATLGVKNVVFVRLECLTGRHLFSTVILFKGSGKNL